MADASLVFELLADDRDFKQKIASIGRNTEHALSAAGGAISGIGKALTTGITLPLGVAAGAAIKFGINSANAAERSEIALTTMLKSADKAKQMMKDIGELAKKGPFEVQGLTESTQKMLAYGFSAEKVLPLLKSIGDATAGLGGGAVAIDRVATAMGQIKAKGKLQAEEMRQLTEAGIPAWDMLAKKLGTDVAGAMELCSKRAIDADTAIDALKEGMDENFGGMAEKQSATLAGALSNLKDAAENASKSLYKQEGYKKFVKGIQHISEAIEPLVEGMMPKISNGLGRIGDALQSLSVQNLRELVAALKVLAATGPALTVVGKSIQAASIPFRVFTNLCPVAENAALKLAKTFGKDYKEIRELKRDLKELGGKGLKSFIESAEKMASPARQKMSKMGTAIKQGLLHPLKSIKSINIPFDQMFTASKDGVKKFASAAKSSLASVANAAKNPLQALSSLKNSVASLGSTIKQMSVGRLTGALTLLKANAASAVGIFMSFSQLAVVASVALTAASVGVLVLAGALFGVTTAAAAAGTNLQEMFSGAQVQILQFADMAVTAITGFANAIPQAAEAVAQNAPYIISALVTAFSSIGEALVKAGSAIQENLPTFIQAVIDGIVALAPMLLQGAILLFAGLIEALATTIETLTQNLPQIAESLGGALESAAPALLDAAGHLFQAIVDALPVVLPLVLQGLLDLVTGAIQFIISNAPAMLEGAFNLFIAIVESIPVIIPQLLTAVGQMILNVIKNFPSFLGAMLKGAFDLFMAIVKAIGTVVPNVLTAMGNLLSDAKDAILNFDLIAAGKALINGLIDGIKAAAQGVVDAVCGAVNGAINAAKNLLGIHSPSRLFRKFGVYTDQGFILGIKDEQSHVVRAMDNLMDDVAAAGSRKTTLNSKLNLGMQAALGATGAHATNNYSIGKVVVQARDLAEATSIEDFFVAVNQQLTMA